MNDRRERGVALLSVLGLISLTLPLAIQLHLQNQVDGWIAANARHHAQALYTAEAGIAAALSVLAAGTDASTVEFGADGVAGTDDDERFPFPPGHRTEFPEPRFSYAVRVRRLGASRLELTSYATGPRHTRRSVVAVVELDASTDAPTRIGWRELP